MTNFAFPRTWRALAAVVLLLAAFGAAATTLDVSPVSHELGADRPALAMTLGNRGTEPVTLQVRGFAWTQPDGSDRLLPAAEVLVAPAIFVLAPGQSQVLRALVQGAASAQERSYRLLIDELPGRDADASVRMALRLSVPVFVRGAGTPAAARLEARLPPGNAALIVGNLGAARERIHQLELLTADGQRIEALRAGGPYLLAGAERRWVLPDAARALPAGAGLRLSALTDAGRIEVPLVVAP